VASERAVLEQSLSEVSHCRAELEQRLSDLTELQRSEIDNIKQVSQSLHAALHGPVSLSLSLSLCAVSIACL